MFRLYKMNNLKSPNLVLLIDTPAVHDVFQSLFCACIHTVEKDFELPTLIHFAAKFGFKELCAKLTDLPDASYAGKFTNCNGQQPNDIAKVYRHSELCRFLETFLEMVGYAARYSKHGRSHQFGCPIMGHSQLPSFKFCTPSC